MFAILPPRLDRVRGTSNVSQSYNKIEQIFDDQMKKGKNFDSYSVFGCVAYSINEIKDVHK